MLPLFILKFIARQCPVKRIFLGDNEYLQRFYLGTLFGYNVYLHRMLGPDGDRDLHNHPWDTMISFVLNGKYLERRLQFGFQQRRIEYIAAHVINTVRGFYFLQENRFFNHMDKHTWHSIIQITEPETWTLFIHSPWVRTWGFLRKIGYEAAAEKVGSSQWWKKADTPRGKDLPNL